MKTETAAALSAQRRICIGTITRGRPQMLAALLLSYSRMQVPPDVHLHFVIVENNHTPTLAAVVEAFAGQVERVDVQYEIEPNLGIAFARNRVMECALAAGDDLLAFADDDEMVTVDWLVHLLWEQQSSDLDIVGSPVRLAPLSQRTTSWRHLVWSGLNKANRHSEAKAKKSWEAKKAGRIKLATGSWMGRLAFFRRTGLRFDNALGLAGGEDWRLWSDAHRLGAKTGWSPDAIVYETIPLERLSIRYQYRRARDTSMTLFATKIAARKTRTLARLPGSLIGRTLTLVFYVVAIPFTRGTAIVRAATCLGNIVGLLQACRGRISTHYDKPLGS